MQNSIDRKKSALVISLDFEMTWGCIEGWFPEGYGKTNIAQVPQVIDGLIKVFNKYGVHATFGAVGFMFRNNVQEITADMPELIPGYIDNSFQPYGKYLKQISEQNYNLYFCPDVIKKLSGAEGIEVGSHTYCHFYCDEPGQTIEEFEADTKMLVKMFDNFNLPRPKSIIFPRNQVSKPYLKICSKYGINIYRGLAPRFFGTPKSKLDRLKKRVCRILDNYINIGGMSTISYDTLTVTGEYVNIPASRFVRPYSKKLAFLEWLQIYRMKKEMIHAAQKGEMYHIYWHPHNFGANMDKNFAMLEKVLLCYKECQMKYGMKSFTMAEMFDYLKKQ